jgi:L-lactate dehydrogenase complex protein LldG
MDSRSNILSKLKAAQKRFDDVPAIPERRSMSPVEDLTPAALQTRFVYEAEALGCQVACLSDPDQALGYVVRLIAPDTTIQSWDCAHIPLPGLADTLMRAGIDVVSGDSTVRVGLTGVDAALAGTGSLVLATGPGKPRQPSLVPPVHIAVLTTDQIVPNLDTWAVTQRANNFQHVRSASSVVVISGPSRTGDIANIPVRGVHGPGRLQIVIVQNA